jgi:phosphoribosyl-AMP cyclohydrolase
MMETTELKNLQFDSNHLIPAIVQDANTNQVLMMAYMNEESLDLTIQTRETHFWSRSRGQLWHKGDTSGNIQKVIDIRVDCDGDTLLILVQPAGPACHTGEESCFYRNVEKS